ncbi:MAG: hypothetical protein JNK02_11090 [Planctomycetes bacterium]|nr:hypothetical protein [Planctomycetota bacterium]
MSPRDAWHALLLVVCACSGPSAAIDRLWAELEHEAEQAAPLAAPDAESEAAAADRARRARALHESGALRSARDHLRAAVLLAESSSPADWPLAAELGARAAELGEPLGLRAAAEAIDKDLVAQRLPQRYGTQFVWDAVRRCWRLHPLDPATTDEERAAMGVPPYGDLVQAEVELNLRAPR